MESSSLGWGWFCQVFGVRVFGDGLMPSFPGQVSSPSTSGGIDPHREQGRGSAFTPPWKDHWPSIISCLFNTCTIGGLSSYDPRCPFSILLVPRFANGKHGKSQWPLLASHLTPQVFAQPTLCLYPYCLLWRLCPGTQWVLSPFFNEQKIKQCLCNIPSFLSGYLNYHPNRTFVIFNLDYFRSFLIGSPSSLMMKPSSTLLSTYFS